MAKSGPEGVLKKDPAAEKAPDAGAVDSDKAKAKFAAHAPSPPAVFWSKFPRPTGPPTAPTGVTPALKNPAKAAVGMPVTEDSPALEPVTAGGAPLPSIKEFSEEEPVPSASILRSVPMRLTPSRFRCVGRR